MASTFGFTRPAGSPFTVSASAMFSKPVSVSSRFESWKMKPSCSRRNFVSWRDFRRVTSSPLTSTAPPVTLSMVETQLSSVDLPEPEAPMMPTKSPFATVNETSRSACVTLLRLPYTFSIWRTSSTGAAAGAAPAAAEAAPPNPMCRALFSVAGIFLPFKWSVKSMRQKGTGSKRYLLRHWGTGSRHPQRIE